MKNLFYAVWLLLAIGTGCAKTQIPSHITPFFTKSLNLYNMKTEKMLQRKIQSGDNKDLTLLVILSPRPLHSDFDLHNCGETNNDTDNPLVKSRKYLCDYHMEFLSSISSINLEFSPYRFHNPLSGKEQKILSAKRVVGAIYIKRTNSAVLVESIDRHNVYEKVETWFLPFISGLECNWADINVEQWAKPNEDISPEKAGLANVDMSKKAKPIDASLVAGYTFSDNYRYNILDNLPRLILSLR